jgi:hypothetical protein
MLDTLRDPFLNPRGSVKPLQIVCKVEQRAALVQAGPPVAFSEQLAPRRPAEYLGVRWGFLTFR